MPTGYICGLSLDRNSPVSARILFVTANGSVYRSRDDGLTWNLVFQSTGCRVTAVDNHDGNLIYAGGEAGLFRSRQGGNAGTWVKIGPAEFTGGSRPKQFWEGGWTGVAAIHPDPARSGCLWVAVHGPGRGLYRSTDDGQTWTPIRNDPFQRGVAVDPANPMRIYATASSAFSSGGKPESSGVMVSNDGGLTWTNVNDGLAWPFAIQVVLEPGNSRTLWIGSPGTGVLRRRF
ncbi:MAG: hypothetical protein NZ483_06100 [Verrucomicrobiae bacterium]|nr:hypothetical protein [Verrucomicrobiae bacterium]